MKRSCWIIEILNPVDGDVLWRKKGARLAEICAAWTEQTGNDHLTVAKLHNWDTKKRETWIRVTKAARPISEVNVEDVNTNG